MINISIISIFKTHLEEGKQDIKRQAYSVGDNDDDILPKEYIEEAKVVEKDEWDLSNIE